MKIMIPQSAWNIVANKALIYTIYISILSPSKENVFKSSTQIISRLGTGYWMNNSIKDDSEGTERLDEGEMHSFAFRLMGVAGQLIINKINTSNI